MGDLKALIQLCSDRKINFIYALAPGLDISYSKETDFLALEAKFSQMVALGVRHFAILFDDIPSALLPEDAAVFKSFAEAQTHVSNRVLQSLKQRCEPTLLFCPTVYCSAFAKYDLAGNEYLVTLGNLSCHFPLSITSLAQLMHYCRKDAV